MDRHDHGRSADAGGNAQPRRSFERTDRGEQQGLSGWRSGTIPRCSAPPRRWRSCLCSQACTPGGQFDPTTLFNIGHVRQQDEAERPARTAVSQRRSRHDHRRAGGSGQGLSTAARSDRRGCRCARRAGSGSGHARKAGGNQSRNPSRKSRSARPRTRSAQVEKPPSSAPTRIDIGAKGAPPQQPSDAAWPNSPPAAQQGGQFAWPAPPQTRTGPAGRAAVAIDLAGSAAHGPDAARGGAVSRIKFAIGTVIRFDVAQACGGQHVHPIVRSSVLERPPLGGTLLCVNDLCAPTRRCAWPALG